MSTSSAPAQVLLVDDHRMWRQMLRMHLDLEPLFEVVGEAADGEQAVAAAAALAPDLILLDLDLGGSRALDFLPSLRLAAPAARVVVLSGSERVEDVVAALGAGAAGFMSKQHPVEHFPAALQAVHEGQSLLPPGAASAVLEEFRRRSGAANGRAAGTVLTGRELDVLRLLASSASNRAIGRELFISENTVKTHVKSILFKLEAHTRVEAVTIALRSGLLEPPVRA